jgi:response regulator NasT
MPGTDGLEVARLVTEERICGVLILTAFSQREVVEQARDAGALAYLVKPFQKSDLIPAIEVAMGRFRELQSLTGSVDQLERQLESRKLIDRAKGLLMAERDLSEADAYRALRKLAMDRGMRLSDVAEEILAIAKLPQR